MTPILLPLEKTNRHVLTAVNAIYQEAFEPEERISFDALVEWATRPSDHYLPQFRVVMDGGEVKGMATFGYAVQERMGYLAYIGIRNDLRGQGLGEWMCRQAFEELEATGRKLHNQPPVCTFWETRDPRDSLDEVTRQHRLRRQRFYQKLGAHTLPMMYLTPAVEEGFPDVACQVMVYTYPPGRPLTYQEVKTVGLTGLIMFNGAAPNSQYVAKMLDSLKTYPDQAA
jgi:ribosomal protein S18 acetylase RimI-like enzyme